MSEKVYDVIFDEVHSSTNDGWGCGCSVSLAGKPVWGCRFAIDRLTLRKWEFKDSDVSAVLVKCGLKILEKKLERGIPGPWERFLINSDGCGKPQGLEKAQTRTTYQLSIMTKIGF